ncbi:MAG: TlyA family RNA methyltransferase [Actinomycetota bacterium]|nr:TlyA family RNA methyltransferase [Actinomycetota bacterium]
MARRAIQEGRVTVGGMPAFKPDALVSPESSIKFVEDDTAYVSRGGRKLEGALDAFDLEVEGRRWLDAGASTGGFTDCLLRWGAASVIALDVGYGQLDWRLRNDPRVEVLERTNVRQITREQLPYEPQAVVADLSFISLRLVLPDLAGVAADDADFVVLVKPQFEAGREHVVRGGVVRDPTGWRAALESVIGAGEGLGLLAVGGVVSPLRGPAGNVEFFVHLCRRGGAEVDLVERLLNEVPT